MSEASRPRVERINRGGDRGPEHVVEHDFDCLSRALGGERDLKRGDIGCGLRVRLRWRCVLVVLNDPVTIIDQLEYPGLPARL